MISTLLLAQTYGRMCTHYTTASIETFKDRFKVEGHVPVPTLRMSVDTHRSSEFQ